MYDFTTSVPNPATMDYNLYYDTGGATGALLNWQGKSLTGFSAYKTASGQEAHSQFADPLYANITTAPYNFDLASGSPAINAGTNLGVNTVGVLDYAGNPRVNANGQVNVGAYEQ
ncbi:MAG TPA: choice-of-anchor Q domain-containing protein [Dongiaceae bacterium]|nr:choice-of-anchor Q domain-containing protein [Dongiaceae bacterium]